MIADLDVADGPARALANRGGCVVVSVNYQKAPEHKFPIPLDDCYAALCWTAATANPYASPLRAADLSGLPPAFIATGEIDPLRDDGERYAQRLGEAGVRVKLTRYDGMIHGFYWMSGVLDKARELHEETGKHARSALGG